MTLQAADSLTTLYALDETEWLDRMAELVRDGRVEDFDLVNLAEYLSDMAGRDRREVESRLIVLIMHVLKWEHQQEQRSRSWKVTIIERRQELSRNVGRGVLRNHAEAVLADIYPEAVERASAETGLPIDHFPATCPLTLDQLLTFDPNRDDA